MDEKLMEYMEKFGESFPTIPLAWDRSEKEVIKIIDKCLKTGKTVYQLGLVTSDSEVYY